MRVKKGYIYSKLPKSKFASRILCSFYNCSLGSADFNKTKDYKPIARIERVKVYAKALICYKIKQSSK